MSYEGGSFGTLKALWSPDLTTQAGAEAATDSAGTAFYIVAVIQCVGLLWLASFYFSPYRVSDILSNESILALQVVSIAQNFFTGWRLKQGQGLYLGAFAALLYLINTALNPTILGIVLGVVLLGAMYGGLRGAYRLQSSASFEDS